MASAVGFGFDFDLKGHGFSRADKGQKEIGL
jgi:hypothetical protein